MNWWWSTFWKFSFCWMFVVTFTYIFAEVKMPSQSREIASQYKFVPHYDASFKQ
jgi:hypothetical protein